MQAVRWSCIKDDNCGNFPIQCKKTDTETFELDKKTTHSIDNIKKNAKFIFSAKEINAFGDSEWGKEKSHISGYDISKAYEKPSLVLVEEGENMCEIRFKPPCNYVGDVEYEIKETTAIPASNQGGQYTRWSVFMYIIRSIIILLCFAFIIETRLSQI